MIGKRISSVNIRHDLKIYKVPYTRRDSRTSSRTLKLGLTAMTKESIPLVIITLFSCFYFANSKIRQIPIPDELQECYNRVQGVKVDQYVGSIYSWLCEHSLINATNFNGRPQINPDTAKYVKELIDIATGSSSNEDDYRTKRQSNPAPCVRKEYRMLTLDERTRYHNAVNALKRDTSVTPNRHDTFGNIHTGATNAIAHGGPGFLGWHRIFLWLYETALRQVDPTVCLPYWDSSLDNQLTNPLSSSLWTAEYLGTPRGAVVSGPFAGWRLPNGGQLIRNVGADGDLMNQADIRNVLSRTSYNQIVTSSFTFTPFNLESFHGAPHIYVGGAMSQLNTAAFDPVFYLHHAFIDYIFERFRARLRSVGVNPETYPSVTTNTRHRASAPTGFTGFNQAGGYLESLARRATYEPVPTCSSSSPSCGNRFLVCQVSTGRCLPTTGTSVVKRSALSPCQPDTCNKQPSYGLPHQNDYCDGQDCDTNQWAMVPVRIVSVRPPKFQTYNSFPVWSGSVDERLDIYAPAAYNQTRRFIINGQGNPKTYNRCERDEPAGQIFLYSHGMNYAGYYKESTVVDQKLPVSVSMGLVGVKRPSPGEGGVSKALLRAHDSCGRVCHVACKDPYTNEFKICSGAVAVSTEKPLMFGYTLDEAVFSIFDYKFDSACPKFQADNVFITFFCDYRDKFPFVKSRPS
ncbi:putative tyrosinase-like protein tyr-3 [Bulinus truncatus]|nr:putative tyrosinase-like protein tyr-3 [Bulinus truncatus]